MQRYKFDFGVIAMTSNMKRIRESKGLSQKEVAALLDMPVRRYGSYEREERTLSLEVASQIADVFSVTLDELMNRDFPNPVMLNHEEAEIVRIMRSITAEGKKELMIHARGILATYPKNTEIHGHKTA